MSGHQDMQLGTMDRELSILANAPCLTLEARQAAKHANELLRAIRGSLGVSWGYQASDLYDLVMNLQLQPKV